MIRSAINFTPRDYYYPQLLIGPASRLPGPFSAVQRRWVIPFTESCPKHLEPLWQPSWAGQISDSFGQFRCPNVS